MNLVILMGTVLNIEHSHSKNGSSHCEIYLVTNKKFKDRSGHYVNIEEWHNVVAFGKKAESIINRLKKGSQVLIRGYIKNEKIEKDNVKFKSTKIICDEIIYLSPKTNGHDFLELDEKN